MITRARNNTKKKKERKTDRQSPRTNGKSKALQTKLHKEAYTYTHKKEKKEKKRKKIYIKGREQPDQLTNLPMIISSKY